MGEKQFRVNDLVRIGKGRKVYRVSRTFRAEGSARWQYYLEADAKHPDASERVPDAFRWYTNTGLVKVAN